MRWGVSPDHLATQVIPRRRDFAHWHLPFAVLVARPSIASASDEAATRRASACRGGRSRGARRRPRRRAHAANHRSICSTEKPAAARDVRSSSAAGTRSVAVLTSASPRSNTGTPIVGPADAPATPVLRRATSATAVTERSGAPARAVPHLRARVRSSIAAWTRRVPRTGVAEVGRPARPVLRVSPYRFARRGTHHRHRRAPQRRQVDAVQRAHQGRGARRELPVRHDRAQRRRRPAARPAARRAGRGSSRASRSCRPRSRSSTSPASSRARARARASATSSSPTSARPTRSARSCASSPTTTSSTSSGTIDPADDIEVIHTELMLADLQTIEKAIPRIEKEVKGKKTDRAVLDAVLAAQELLEDGTTLFAGAEAAGIDVSPAARAVAHDGQAVHLRLQRRRGGPHRHRPPGRAARPRGAGGRGVPDAKLEAELLELDDDDAAELLASVGQTRAGHAPARPGRLPHPRAPDLPHRGTDGVARLDDPPGLDRPAGRRRDPHRLPARVHQGRGRVLRRPRRRRARWPRRRRAARSGSRARTT